MRTDRRFEGFSAAPSSAASEKSYNHIGDVPACNCTDWEDIEPKSEGLKKEKPKFIQRLYLSKKGSRMMALAKFMAPPGQHLTKLPSGKLALVRHKRTGSGGHYFRETSREGDSYKDIVEAVVDRGDSAKVKTALACIAHRKKVLALEKSQKHLTEELREEDRALLAKEEALRQKEKALQREEAEAMRRKEKLLRREEKALRREAALQREKEVIAAAKKAYEVGMTPSMEAALEAKVQAAISKLGHSRSYDEVSGSLSCTYADANSDRPTRSSMLPPQQEPLAPEHSNTKHLVPPPIIPNMAPAPPFYGPPTPYLGQWGFPVGTMNQQFPQQYPPIIIPQPTPMYQPASTPYPQGQWVTPQQLQQLELLRRGPPNHPPGPSVSVQPNLATAAVPVPPSTVPPKPTVASASDVTSIREPGSSKKVHRCLECGKVRSKQYHIEHPIVPGGEPIGDYCHRCQKEETTVGGSSLTATSLGYSGTQEETDDETRSKYKSHDDKQSEASRHAYSDDEESEASNRHAKKRAQPANEKIGAPAKSVSSDIAEPYMEEFNRTYAQLSPTSQLRCRADLMEIKLRREEIKHMQKEFGDSIRRQTDDLVHKGSEERLSSSTIPIVAIDDEKLVVDEVPGYPHLQKLRVPRLPSDVESVAEGSVAVVTKFYDKHTKDVPPEIGSIQSGEVVTTRDHFPGPAHHDRTKRSSRKDPAFDQERRVQLDPDSMFEHLRNTTSPAFSRFSSEHASVNSSNYRKNPKDDDSSGMSISSQPKEASFEYDYEVRQSYIAEIESNPPRQQQYSNYLPDEGIQDHRRNVSMNTDYVHSHPKTAPTNFRPTFVRTDTDGDAEALYSESYSSESYFSEESPQPVRRRASPREDTSMEDTPRQPTYKAPKQPSLLIPETSPSQRASPMGSSYQERRSRRTQERAPPMQPAMEPAMRDDGVRRYIRRERAPPMDPYIPRRHSRERAPRQSYPKTSPSMVNSSRASSVNPRNGVDELTQSSLFRVDGSEMSSSELERLRKSHSILKKHQADRFPEVGHLARLVDRNGKILVGVGDTERSITPHKYVEESGRANALGLVSRSERGDYESEAERRAEAEEQHPSRTWMHDAPSIESFRGNRTPRTAFRQRQTDAEYSRTPSHKPRRRTRRLPSRSHAEHPEDYEYEDSDEYSPMPPRPKKRNPYQPQSVSLASGVTLGSWK